MYPSNRCYHLVFSSAELNFKLPFSVIAAFFCVDRDINVGAEKSDELEESCEVATSGGGSCSALLFLRFARSQT